MDASCVGSGSSVAIVFDGDDTLWSTERLYDEARAAARAVVEETGLDGSEWEAIERRVDVANVAKFGFSPARFPTSCIEAYQELCTRREQPIDTAIMKRVDLAAQTVFARRPQVFPRAREVLSWLRDCGASLALLTKGDEGIQRMRVETSGLADLFDVVRIVRDKTPSCIRSLVSDLGGAPASSWMVGNSVRSDILPALAAQLNAIWIDAPVWEHERTHDHHVDDRVVVLKNLEELPAALATVFAQGATVDAADTGP